MSNISSVNIFICDLPTVRPHKLAMTTITSQAIVIGIINDEGGITRVSEVATIGGASYGESTVEAIKANIDHYITPHLIGQDPISFSRIINHISKSRRISMTERIQTKEKMINVNKTGNGKKDVLLIFIHGLTGNYLQMHHFQKHFKETCVTLSYDLSGRGDSSIQSDPTNIHQHTEDLLQLMNSLDYDKFILAGYSMGGGVANEDTSNLVIPSLGRLEKSFDSSDDYLDMMKQSYGALGVKWSAVMNQVIAHEFNGAIHPKSDYTLTKQDFESFYEYPHSKIYQNVKIPVLLIICTGPTKDNTPLFSKEGYSLMLETVSDIKSTNHGLIHYEIVFNNNPDLNKEIKEFIEME